MVGKRNANSTRKSQGGKKVVKGKLPALKKEVKDFLLGEAGNITEKKIAKLGIVLGGLALMSKADIVGAQWQLPAHTSNQLTNIVVTGDPSNPAAYTTGGHHSHGSHASHGSHSSHSSHSSYSGG